MSSEAIASVGYDRATNVLELELAEGEVYRYYAVPRRVHQELQDILGHASPETTRRSYAHYVRKDFAAGLRLPMPAIKKS